MDKNSKPLSAGELLEKLFGGEPILLQTFVNLGLSRSQKLAERALNQKIKKMRLIRPQAATVSILPTGNAILFVAQSDFMKDVVYSKPTATAYSSYLPRFAEMSDSQLQTYFYLRTRLREGAIVSLPPAYRLLYIYELLNNIEGTSIFDRAEKLSAFCADKDEAFLALLRGWLRDYFICEDFDMSFSQYIAKFHFESLYDGEDISEFTSGSRYAALSETIRIAPNRFTEQLPENYLADCFEIVCDRLEASLSERGIKLSELLFGRERKTYSYVPFRGALYAQNANIRSKTAVISTKEQFECRGGVWNRVLFHSYCNKSVAFYILRVMENRLRALSGYRYRLSLPSLGAGGEPVNRLMHGTSAILDGAALSELVESAADIFFHSGHELSIGQKPERTAIKKAAAKTTPTSMVQKLKSPLAEVRTPNAVRKPLELDLSRIEQVRADTQSLEAKFVYDDEAFVEAQYPPPKALEISAGKAFDCQDEWECFRQMLDKNELSLLADLCIGLNAMASEIVMEQINGKALEALGDNVISFEADAPQIYEEYSADIMRITKGE